MRRIAAALLTLTIALGGKTAFAQTIATINSAAPTSVISGSGDTVITLTLRQSNTTRYNVCFYSGATSASIVPTTYNFANAPATVMYTFTVPGARFQTGTAAATDTIYLAAAGASVPNGCTGTNQGISNLFQYNVTASGYALRTVTPSTLASGSATTNVTLTGVFPTFPTNGSGLGLCFYAGANNTPLLPNQPDQHLHDLFLRTRRHLRQPRHSQDLPRHCQQHLHRLEHRLLQLPLLHHHPGPALHHRFLLPLVASGRRRKCCGQPLRQPPGNRHSQQRRLHLYGPEHHAHRYYPHVIHHDRDRLRRSRQRAPDPTSQLRLRHL